MGIKKFFQNLFKKKEARASESSASDMGESSQMARGAEKDTKNKSEEGAPMVCVDCGTSFLFLPGEQKFFKKRGLTPPKRCPSCRAKRKQKKNQ